MVINAITDKPLLTIFTYDGHQYYIEATLDEYDANKPMVKGSLREITFTNGTKTRYSNIKLVRNANSIEWFNYFVVPKLPKDEKMWWKDSTKSITGKPPKLEMILAKLEEYRARKHYVPVKRTEEEKQRFREIVARHRKQFSFLQSKS